MTSIAQLFGAKVPRYTSYPTAPHFHDGIGAAAYRGWLAALPPDMPLSLYVHIPFCDTLCWFCGCHTSVVHKYAPVHDYCGLLQREMALVAAFLGPRRPVQHIHWGGGSPTILQPDDIAALSATIHSHFDVAPGAEFAVEIDPRKLNGETVLALAGAGVTRASIGLQDCNIEVQRAINRIQSDEETVYAIRLIREAGIKALNIDLVYGLPKQDRTAWEKTLDFALRLNPDRLAIFGYAHVPEFKKHQALIATDQLAGVQERFAMAEAARQILCAHGYVAIGLDHFAKPDDPLAQAAAATKVHRNFQGYTVDAAPALLGFGASAIGSLPQGYVQNFPAVPQYRKALEDGVLPVARGIALSEDDRIHREVIEKLMCDLHADLPAIAAAHGQSADIFAGSLPALQSLAAEGVISLKDGAVCVDPTWRPAVRLVCAAFDQYLPQSGVRHSIAV